MSKVRDIIGGGFVICGDVHVYDCRNTELSWHDAERFEDINDEVLDMDVAYMCVDGYTLQIEAFVRPEETSSKRDGEIYNQAVRDVLNGLNTDGFFCGNEVEGYLLERYLK